MADLDPRLEDYVTKAGQAHGKQYDSAWSGSAGVIPNTVETPVPVKYNPNPPTGEHPLMFGRNWLGTQRGDARAQDPSFTSSGIVTPPQRDLAGTVGQQEADIAPPYVGSPAEVVTSQEGIVPSRGTVEGRKFLQDGQGYIDTGSNWDSNAAGKSVMNLADQQTAQRRSEAELANPQTGIYTGPNGEMMTRGGTMSALDKEAAANGGIEAPIRESDDAIHDRYRNALRVIGDNVPTQLKLSMLKEFHNQADNKFKVEQEFVAKRQELMAAHGVNSPSMINAQSNASVSQANIRHQDIQNQIALARSPADIEHLAAQSANLRGEAALVPSKAALNQAHVNFYQAQTERPEYQHLKAAGAGLLEMVKSSFGPQQIAAEEKYREFMSNGMAQANKIMKALPELQRRMPGVPMPSVAEIASGQPFKVGDRTLRFDGNQFAYVQ